MAAAVFNGGEQWHGYPTPNGIHKVLSGLWAAAAASVGIGLTLENWAAILGSLASLCLTLMGAAILFIRVRKPRTFAKPEKPPANAPIRVHEAYYRALEEYNRSIDEQQL